MTYALEISQLTKQYAGGVQALRGIDLKVSTGDFYALLGPNGAGKSTTIGIISSLVNKTGGKVSVFGYDIDTDLVLAKRQLGLVPLMHQPKLLILDEPTAGVDIELRRSMWGFLKTLNAQGTTIILTTHYLEEAEMLCRNIGIIQHGELVENTSMKALLGKLESETFILDLGSKNPLPQLEGYTFRLTDTSTLEVDVRREQGLNGVFAQLNAQGIDVLSMRNKANRLEELFVHLVNHDLEAAK